MTGEASPLRCVAPAAPIRREPSANSEQTDQLLFGEDFDASEERGGWAFGRASRDGYQGWVELSALAERGAEPTHWVSALRTYAFPAPEKKAAPPVLYSMNALVRVEAREGRWFKAEGTGWIPEPHLRAIGDHEADPAAVAERFVGAPYLWGGRESLGLDCSGLVQQALYACGRACPRDSGVQARELGSEIPAAEPLRRGDLVFWRGHVAMMLDAARMIHANSWHMATVVEPLAEALQRREAAGRGPVTGRRRL